MFHVDSISRTSYFEYLALYCYYFDTSGVSTMETVNTLEVSQVYNLSLKCVKCSFTFLPKQDNLRI